MDQPDILETLIKSHDWDFSYSDDHSAYMRGCASFASIQRTLLTMTADEARPVWERHAPKEYSFRPEMCKASAT